LKEIASIAEGEYAFCEIVQKNYDADNNLAISVPSNISSFSRVGLKFSYLLHVAEVK
jgi:hypothetical protein